MSEQGQSTRNTIIAALIGVVGLAAAAAITPIVTEMMQDDPDAAGRSPTASRSPAPSQDVSDSPGIDFNPYEPDVSGGYLTAALFGATVHARPAANAAVILELPPGAVVRVVGSGDVDPDGQTWLQIQTESGDEGWVRESDLS